MFAKHLHYLNKKAAGFLVATKGIQQNANIAVAACNEFTPVSIDVPWGTVEGKLWGNGTKQPIVALHGWMDNAGVFDSVIPLLLRDSPILALDLPGHGLSSWLPRGSPYTMNMYTMTLRTIVKHFHWDKVKLIGHSLGGIICGNYSRLYPEETQFFVDIDGHMNVVNTVAENSRVSAEEMDNYIKFVMNMSDSAPSYPEEVAIDKWVKGAAFKSLDVPTVQTLMIRGAKRNEDGTCSFTRDVCAGLIFTKCPTFQVAKDMVKLITSPCLIIKISDKPSHDRFKFPYDVIECLVKSNKYCEFVTVRGNHHVFMLEPEVIASHIVPFLKKYDV